MTDSYNEINPPPIDEIPLHADSAEIHHFPSGQSNWKQSLGWTEDDESEAMHSQTMRAINSPAIQSVTALNGMQFLQTNIPEREYFLAPWLPIKGLCMLHAWRGVGKTMLSLSIAKAVATGSRLAKWVTSQSYHVIYVDGEMAARQMQDRLRAIAGNEDLSSLTLICDDLQNEGLPDLSTLQGQQVIEQHLKPQSLLILDNISCLFRDGSDENDARSWKSAADWLRKLRRDGHSVLLIHHTGKGGAQRGTSKREDILDSVVHLKRSDDYSPTEGAVFEVHFEKCRGAFGDDVLPFKLHYHNEEGQPSHWTTSEIVDHDYQAVVNGLAEGQSVRAIAQSSGLSKSKVDRLCQQAKAKGDA